MSGFTKQRRVDWFRRLRGVEADVQVLATFIHDLHADNTNTARALTSELEEARARLDAVIAEMREVLG